MRASDADRERVAQILHNALAEGRITVQELEERLDAVYAAKTLAELEPPVSDLPVTGAGVVAPATPRALTPDERIGGVPGSTMSVAVMSGVERKGPWTVPPQHTSFAFWGGVDIDLRNARFAERQTTITAVAIMGGIDIVVPDDIIVEVTGSGLMGAFETQERRGVSQQPPPPGAPVVKVNGFAFWGGVTVTRKPRKGSPPQLDSGG